MIKLPKTKSVNKIYPPSLSKSATIDLFWKFSKEAKLKKAKIEWAYIYRKYKTSVIVQKNENILFPTKRFIIALNLNIFVLFSILYIKLFFLKRLI